MTIKNAEISRALKELSICAQLVSVMVIMKGAEICGRITSRRPDNGYMTFIAVDMHIPKTDGDTEERYIYGHEMIDSGCGMKNTNVGIAKILVRNRKELKKHYGLDIPEDVDGVSGKWREYFRKGGYTIFDAI